MLGLRVVIRSVENKTLFCLKLIFFLKLINMKVQYEQIQTALGNTNKILLSHAVAGCLSEYVKKGKLVLRNTNKKLK